MRGKILGFDEKSGSGVISGENGERYRFSKNEWKEESLPLKGMDVDFKSDNKNMAQEIYTTDHLSENSSAVLGIVSIAITLFFGFIGTLISRMILSKHSFAQALIPTAIHFVITILFFVPVIGWLIYLVGTAYYVIKNYKLVTDENQ